LQAAEHNVPSSSSRRKNEERRNNRSNQPEVRNPVLALPAMAAILQLSVDQREIISQLFVELRNQAKQRANRSWNQRKAMMAAYWSITATYAGHAARAIRRGSQP